MPEESTEIQEASKSSEKLKSVSDKERLNIQIGEATRRVKNGEDREGNLLFNAFKDTLAGNPEALGSLGATYKKALESRENIDEPGEENKLFRSLKYLYKQAELGEYQIKIVVPEGASNTEKASLVQEELSGAIDSFADRVVSEKYMNGYYEERAKLDISAENTRELIKRDGLNSIEGREEIRDSAFALERGEKRLQLLGENILNNLGEQGLDNELINRRKERRKYSPEEPKKAQDLSENEQEKLNKQAHERILDESIYGKDEKTERAFTNFSEEEKSRYGNSFLDLEFQEENLKRNFSNSIESSDSEVICTLVADSRELQAKRKILMSEFNVDLARQRSIDSMDDVAKSRIQLAESLTRKNPQEAFKRFLAAGLDAIDHKMSFIAEKQKLKAVKFIEKVSVTTERAEQKIHKITNWFRSNISDTLTQRWESKKEDYREVDETFRNQVLRIRSGLERGRFERKKKIYNIRHGFAVARHRAFAQVGVEYLYGKKELGIKASKIVGKELLSDEERQRHTDRHDRLVAARERWAEIHKERSEKEKEDNPHFQYFTKELQNHVVEISPKLSEEEVESVAEELPPTPTSEEKDIPHKEKEVKAKEEEDEEIDEEGDKEVVEENEKVMWDDIVQAERVVRKRRKNHRRLGQSEEREKQKEQWELALSLMEEKLEKYHEYLNRPMDLTKEVEDVGNNYGKYVYLNDEYIDTLKKARELSLNKRTELYEKMRWNLSSRWNLKRLMESGEI